MPFMNGNVINICRIKALNGTETQKTVLCFILMSLLDNA